MSKPPVSERDTYDEQDLLVHAEKIFTPVTLPCGRVVPNRLVKVPLYEHLSPLFGGPPNETHLALYAKWGAGRWGIIMTGNVQVDPQHLTLGRDMVVPPALTPETLAPWRGLADAIHTGRAAPAAPVSDSHSKDSASAEDAPPALGRPIALIQLSHAGRQSLNILGGRKPFEPPLAPSPIRSGQMHAATDGWFSRVLHQLMHQVPREMTHEDIKTVVAAFVRGAQMAAQSGFDGVQVHAAHGYLVSQFISPKSNARTDEYSADTDPLHFLRDIVTAIRAPGVVPDDFVVAVKLNSADYARGTAELQEQRALDHVREIGSWGVVDFIEVSGGDYEDPQFIDTVNEFKSSRQVIFESFAERSMEILAKCSPTGTTRPPPLVCLTGGLDTLPKMASVLGHEHADLLGIGRLSVIHPLLPVRLHKSIQGRAAGQEDAFVLSPPHKLEEDGLGTPPGSYVSWRGLERLVCYVLTLIWAVVPARLPRLVGAGGNVDWHNMMLRRIAAGQDIDYTMGTIGATFRFYLSPYPPAHEGRGGRWWVVAGLLGVAIGIGLGQVV
ncbi:FMN-linked oxidoreductase [Pilatotrama ljubarskyi]|nr:FMN-linked oxidoreductase [Pilatotrama ljubarskyi]